MRKTKKQKRWLALALCLCMLASVFPLSGMTYAAGTGCNHTHDENCGFVEGQTCTFTHAHDDTCGYAEAKDAAPCSVEASHTHETAVCGYVETVEGQPCTHEHDADCGGLVQDSGPGACTLTENCKLPAGHKDDCAAPMMLENSSADYHPGDVAVVQGIIDRSSLGWNRDDPASWNTTDENLPYLKWGESMPRRIKELRISNADLSGMLDVSGLTSLQILYCNNNPIQSLKLPGGEELTVNVNPASGGTVMFSHSGNLLGTKSVTLAATENAGYAFTEFQFSPDVTVYGKNPVSFRLPTGALTVTPVFTPLYNPADIAAVNNIVEAHPELGWQKTDPADGTVVSPSWAGSVDWSTDKSNRRIWRLNLANKGLTGTLDVSGLPDLDALHCGDNQLEELNGLGTLTKLTTLACPNNRLPKLDGLKNLTALKTPMCQKNQLTALDGLENLTQLMWLDCEENLLTALDVSAQKSNLLLYCQNNPIQSLRLAGGYTLLVPPAVGGSVQMTAFNHSAKKVTLSAKADAGHTFTGWTGDASSSDNPLTLTLDRSMTVTATYHTHKYEGAWQHDDTDHWQLCSCGEVGPKTSHSGGTANCHEKAVCEVCNTVYGNLNPDNHDGGTELRNAKAATEEAEGYTGDTYCLGCGELLAKGKAISKTTLPQTGDDTLLWPWALLMLLALLGGGFLFAGKRRRKIR